MAADDIERRKGLSDIEIGRLVQSVDNLEKKINEEKVSTARELEKLTKKFEGFLSDAKEWQKMVESQAKKDYLYLDKDIVTPLSIRIYELEKWKGEKEKEEIQKRERDKNSLFAKIKDRALTSVVSIVVAGALVIVGYFLIEWAKKQP